MKDKIKKYLLKQKEITLKAESSTNSIYFKLHNETIIRLSDHINPQFNEPDKINIVVSADGTGCIVILGNRIMQFDKYEKVREWLKFYIKSSYCLKLIPKTKVVEIKKEIQIEAPSPITKNPKHQEVLDLLRQIHPDYIQSVIKTIEPLTKAKKSISYTSSHIGNKYTRNGVDFDLTGLNIAQRKQVIGCNCTSTKLKELIDRLKKINSIKNVG